MELEEFLKIMRHSRDDFSDEIPSEILHSTMTSKYKVRKRWFQYSFYCAVELGIHHGYVNEDARQMMQAFRDYAKTTNLSGRLTTHEDINRANEVLTTIIDALEARLSSHHD